MTCGCVVLLFCCLQAASAQTWVIKVSASTTVLGDALASNPLNHDILYGVPGGRQMYVSRDRGYTWHAFGNPVPQVGPQDNVIKSIAVSPLDTLQIVVGVESANSNPDRIMKSTDGGSTWTQTWGGTFTYYGKPVEFKPVHPDTMYTMGNDSLWRSTDFGSTWVLVRTTTGLFNAWCDAELRPDSANVMFLGDYTTGIWKTRDHGVTWKRVFTSSGETPSIAIDPLNPRIMYATQFSGGGGVLKSTDWGESWNNLTTPLGTGPGWWITCSPVNPGYVYFGVYGATPAGIYLSADYGATWRLLNAGLTPSGGINYGLLVIDSLTVVASQINGLWRLQYPGSVHVAGPNGGEAVQGGVAHPLAWTSSNLYSLKLAFTTDNGGVWTTIADSISPSASPYNWVPPAVFSSACRVRITDDILNFVTDQSDTTFTLYTEPLRLHAPLGGERWTAGSSHTIDWLAYNMPQVRLDYSTDGGAGWTYITRVSGYAGSYRWLVPDNPSQECKVRVTSSADSAVSGVSDSLFTISRTAGFIGTIIISDNGAAHDSLKFGAREGGTDGIDPAFGESPLAPKPGEGTFDVRWRIPTGAETRTDVRDTLSGGHPLNTFVAELQPGPGGFPMTLTWNPESLSAGSIILRDTLTHGSLLSADMRLTGSIMIGDSSVSGLEIVQCAGEWYTYPGSGGWLLMSLPFEVGTRKTSTLFPSALSKAFAYQGSYARADTLRYGRGYWLKSEQTSLTGCSRTLDTVSISGGWNIVGALSSPLAVGSLVVSPETLLTSNFFGYDQSYSIADSLRPGKGYWVRSGGSGTIILSSGPPPMGKHVAPRRLPAGLHSMTVSDESNHAQVLYFGREIAGISADSYDLPPNPPEGSFDARFATQSMVALHPQKLPEGAEFPLAITSASPRLKFSWRVDNEEKFTYILVGNLNGKEVGEMHLTGTGSGIMRRDDQMKLSLNVRQAASGPDLPLGFSLGRMYPNPFNPITHFSYALPADARVKISVFDVLGRQVASLVEGRARAGLYQAEWDGNSADGLPAGSGVYYIRMSASARTDFSEVRKVLLIR